MKSIINTLLIILIVMACAPSQEDERKIWEEIDKQITEMYRSYEDKWEQSSLSDKFGDKTGKKCINSYTAGYFSNSATRRADLFVELRVSEDNNVGIFLYEYTSNILQMHIHSPVNPIGDYRIIMKNSAGEIFKTWDAGRWNQQGGIAIRNDEGIINFLKKSIGKVKFIIEDEYSSSYQFTINANGFTAAYNALKQQ